MMVPNSNPSEYNDTIQEASTIEIWPKIKGDSCDVSSKTAGFVQPSCNPLPIVWKFTIEKEQNKCNNYYHLKNVLFLSPIIALRYWCFKFCVPTELIPVFAIFFFVSVSSISNYTKIHKVAKFFNGIMTYCHAFIGKYL